MILETIDSLRAGRGHQAPIAYHRVMLEDHWRMDAYERAIRRLVKPGDVVLDLGSGTGVLGLLAARRGARKVYLIESMAVAEVARDSVVVNGFEGVVEVIRADIRDLDPIEPVDLIVSDYMGRFLVDDNMLDAVESSRAWLKAGGQFCPNEVALIVAPLGGLQCASVESWRHDVYGLSLDHARTYAVNCVYQETFPPDALLADPVCYHRHRGLENAPIGSRTLTFELGDDSPFNGMAGWMDIEFAKGVSMNSGPGFDTHWAQMFFPSDPIETQTGDQLAFTLALDAEAQLWRWSGVITRGDQVVGEFAGESEQKLGQRSGGCTALEPAGDVNHWNSVGSRAFEAENYREATRAFETAARLLTPSDDGLAADIYENVGLSYAHISRSRPAIRAFLRALDGDLTSREQSLRFLVICLYHSGHSWDFQRLLRIYEQTYGPHPTGFSSR